MARKIVSVDGATYALPELVLAKVKTDITPTIATTVGPLVTSALAANSAPATAAAAAVTAEIAGRDLVERYTGDPLDEADWVWYVAYESGEVAYGQKVDGTFYPDTVGLSFADENVTELDQTRGWTFAIYHEDNEVVFGQRTDGTYYPDTLGGAAATTTVTRISGDSLTAGWGAAALATLLGMNVVTEGNGGHASGWIAARQGGQPVRVTSSTGFIPASGSVDVTLSSYAPLGTTVSSHAPGSYAGSLGGIAGVLAITGTGTGSFMRLSAGRQTPLTASTPFVRQAYRDAWPIIWAGRNNFKLAGDLAQVVRDVGDMLDWTTAPHKALVLSIPPWVGEEAGSGVRGSLDSVNNALRDNFPTQFVDTSAMLRSSELISAVGLTPTATDTANILAGLTPESFRLDSGHLNAKGYEALNILIREIYTSRGWII